MFSISPRTLATLFPLLGSPEVNALIERGMDEGDNSYTRLGSAISSLNLPPIYMAIFVINIVIIATTFLQLIRSARRLATSTPPSDCPPPSYQVGRLFCPLLFSYTIVFLLHNVLYAVFVAYGYDVSRSSFLPDGIEAGTSFLAQLSSILILATFLSIISYRGRIHLNPVSGSLNLKPFVDACLLSTVLILGIAADVPTGLDVRNMSVAFQAFLCLACIDVIVSAVMLYIRIKKRKIHDTIMHDMVFIVSPFIFIDAVFRVIDTGLVYTEQKFYLDHSTLDLAGIVIGGIVSITVVEVALHMSAVTKSSKDAEGRLERGLCKT